jgi:hypothetical protein
MKPESSGFQGPAAEAIPQVQVPAQTKRDLQIRTAMTGEPMRLIVKALAAYGFNVPAAALTDRRKQR